MILRGIVMANFLDKYDTDKVKEARKLIFEVYNYNFVSATDPLGRKLETILKKMDNIIDNYGEE